VNIKIIGVLEQNSLISLEFIIVIDTILTILNITIEAKD
jgi:hypothetical protein